MLTRRTPIGTRGPDPTIIVTTARTRWLVLSYLRYRAKTRTSFLTEGLRLGIGLRAGAHTIHRIALTTYRTRAEARRIRPAQLRARLRRAAARARLIGEVFVLAAARQTHIQGVRQHWTVVTANDAVAARVTYQHTLSTDIHVVCAITGVALRREILVDSRRAVVVLVVAYLRIARIVRTVTVVAIVAHRRETRRLVTRKLRLRRHTVVVTILVQIPRREVVDVVHQAVTVVVQTILALRSTQLRDRRHLAHTRTKRTARARLNTLVACANVDLRRIARVTRLLVAVIHIATARRVRAVVVRTQITVIAVLRTGIHARTRLATTTTRVCNVVGDTRARRCPTRHTSRLHTPRRLARTRCTNQAPIITRRTTTLAR